ncbi:transporter [Rhodoblastus acidophilus]|uniref:Transporter n=1 Tax=Candidatus Rhodoblastus alkanivorans TaxID=2954117 RepID=A0ABS9Z9D0_9HYPH|nr:transporter [Candidatus Rhodoblastus alkanivorans]MCI4679711.1 transporter [Candidatus Rhodoblastus alkanivorans]MCI4683227.1 transporter [Candidatus Rhodoblastus alkanivorans]MDI4640539.1 transporter [Rhodoblastus acidophilus]
MTAARLHLILSLVTLCVAASTFGAKAENVPSDRYHDIETKYLFGFTEGTDIGAEGEKELESETTANAGMRGGSFRSIEQELEFEHVPSQFWSYEVAVRGLWSDIHNVDGLDNRDSANYSGFSFKPKFLLIGRGPGNPIGLSLSVEPEWGRIDGTGGGRESSFAMEARLAADTELIANRLFAALNLIYEPEAARAPGDSGWSRASGFGATAAMAFRVTPKVALGGEAEFYRSFQGYGFNTLDGSAFYLGPTLYVQFTPKIFLAAAWSTQVSGHAEGAPGGLDLADFTQQRARLKLGVEF